MRLKIVICHFCWLLFFSNNGASELCLFSYQAAFEIKNKTTSLLLRQLYILWNGCQIQSKNFCSVRVEHTLLQVKALFLEGLGDIDFFLETYLSLLSHWVWRLVSGVLINKVWETEQFEDLLRWTGSTFQKWNHQLEKRLEGGKDTSRSRSLVARVTNVQAHNASTQLPQCYGGRVLCYKPQGKEFIQHLPKCEGQDIQSRMSARGGSPVMQMQGLSLGKAATEARETRSN